MVMCEMGESNQPANIKLPIGVDGITSLSFNPSAEKNILVLGTTGGRVRVLDCSKDTCETLYQKQWHKSIRCLCVNPYAPSMCITASKQACIKVHDLETKKRTGYFTKMEDSSPYSVLLPITDHRWITGDDDGLVKLWDDRMHGGHCFTIKPNTEDVDVDLLGINDLAVGNDPQGTLLAAVDCGCLVTYNIRRRRLEMSSEPLGFSARAVCAVKNGNKVLVGTDEGMMLMYTWGEFGSVCDRFPVRRTRNRIDNRSGARLFDAAGCPAVERILKVNEDVVVVATDDGAINPLRILPNRTLTCLGWHTAEEGVGGGGGDCMALALSTSGGLLASGLPLSPQLKFWSVDHLPAEAEAEAAAVAGLEDSGKGKKIKNRGTKAKGTSRGDDRARQDFLSGLVEEEGDGEEESMNEDEDDSDDSDSDSG